MSTPCFIHPGRSKTGEATPKKSALRGRERSRSRRRNDWGDKGGEDPQTAVVDEVELKNWSLNVGMLLFQRLVVRIYLEI